MGPYADSFFVYGISFDNRNHRQLQDLKILFGKMFPDDDFEDIDDFGDDMIQAENDYYIVSKIDDVGETADIFWICGFIHIHNLGHPNDIDPASPSRIDMLSYEKQTEFKKWISENGVAVDRVGWYTFINIQG